MKQIIFGEVSRAEAERIAGFTTNDNPIIGKFGRDPMGRSCGSCKHLKAKRYSRIYYKCALRGDTNGPGPDHRKKWDACGKYER